MIGLHGRKELVKDVFKPNLPGKAIRGTAELFINYSFFSTVFYTSQ